jgi:hypothetical protein
MQYKYASAISTLHDIYKQKRFAKSETKKTKLLPGHEKNKME